MASKRRSYDEDDSTEFYTDEIAPDENDFLPSTKEIESCTDEDMEVLALALLSNSHDFCNTFVPTQLGILRKQISVVNKRVDKAGCADDYVKLTATMKNLTSTYSQLLEQSTVVFMSSYRPIMALIQKRIEAKKTEEPQAVVEVTNVDTSNEIDTTDLQDGYTKYED